MLSRSDRQDYDAPFHGKRTAHPRRKCIQRILESTRFAIDTVELSIAMVSSSRSRSGVAVGMEFAATGAWGMGWYIASEVCRWSVI